MKIKLFITTLALSVLPLEASSDSVTACCHIYYNDSHQSALKSKCQFSQYQGNIYIDLPKHKIIELHPIDKTPGKYIDQHKQIVYRTRGLGKNGQIYRQKNQTLYVYWDINACKLSSKKTSSIKVRPINYSKIMITINKSEYHFKGFMHRQNKDFFSATDGKNLLLFNVNQGTIYIFQSKTGKLLYSFTTHPIPTFEDPTTMCNPEKEPC